MFMYETAISTWPLHYVWKTLLLNQSTEQRGALARWWNDIPNNGFAFTLIMKSIMSPLMISWWAKYFWGNRHRKNAKCRCQWLTLQIYYQFSAIHTTSRICTLEASSVIIFCIFCVFSIFRTWPLFPLQYRDDCHKRMIRLHTKSL